MVLQLLNKRCILHRSIFLELLMHFQALKCYSDVIFEKTIIEAVYTSDV